MLSNSAAFSGFAVDDIDAARSFYADTLGLTVETNDMGFLEITLGSGGHVIAYPKPDHEPAGFTILNFPVAGRRRRGRRAQRARRHDQDLRRLAVRRRREGHLRGSGPRSPGSATRPATCCRCSRAPWTGYGDQDQAVGQRTTHARGVLARLKLLGSVADVTERAHGDDGDRREVLAEVEPRAEGVAVEAAHLVHVETVGVSLHGEVRDHLAGSYAAKGVGFPAPPSRPRRRSAPQPRPPMRWLNPTRASSTASWLDGAAAGDDQAPGLRCSPRRAPSAPLRARWPAATSSMGASHRRCGCSTGR